MYNKKVHGTWTAEEQAEHRRQWVAALRSGRFQQGKGSLRPTADTYCCLGVACEISGLGKWVEIENDFDIPSVSSPVADVDPNDMHITPAYKYEITKDFGTHHEYGDPTVLPYPVVEWLGLRSEQGSFLSTVDNNRAEPVWLTDMNDGGDSFDVIADVIERNPRELTSDVA